ncbi:methyl-accepting chemotaxis protein [Rhodoblastus sp.]|uniref:methyl-accepting chemotaxis protein n=2 Tax=Rhodoblastus sp. TaxID=1962975 RepID=UPI003F94C884
MSKINFHLSLTRRVWALAALALATMGLGTGLTLYQFHVSALDQRKAELQREVDMAATLLRELVAKEVPDLTDRAGSIHAALEKLRPLRFGESGYLFALDFDGVARLTPNRTELEGEGMLALRDAHGGFPFRSLLATAKSAGAGFASYAWPKPGRSGDAEKVTYVRAIPELGLIVGSGAYVEDIFVQTQAIALHIALVVAPLLLLFLGAAYLIGHTISRRLQSMTSAMLRMARGDYDIVLPGLDRQDELGEMARAVEDFKIGMRQAAQEQSAQRSQQRETAERARSQEMKTLAQKFESAIGGVVSAVAGSTSKLENIARSLVQEARYSGEQAEIGARAAETASSNVQSLAAAAEELTYSVEEIGSQASRSHAISSDAARDAETTRGRMDELAKAIGHIGGIVAMITGIAQQTNMLALNATIEAARAGEQGRGFAVVAQEVKSLAEQTTRATSDVADQIASVQRASREARESIGAMTEATHEVSAIASCIATSVGSQGEATREIAQNVQETSTKTAELNKVIEEVRSASRQSGDSAEQVLQSVTELARHAERLGSECDQFLAQVRMA